MAAGDGDMDRDLLGVSVGEGVLVSDTPLMGLSESQTASVDDIITLTF